MIKLYFAETEDAKAYSEDFVRNILGECLDVDGNNLVIFKNEYGKPYLRDYPDLHYNISHSKGVIVCAVADRPVGVDIERIKPFSRRIEERFFTQNERGYIFVSNESQDERFMEIWTKKEAYVKWLGKGMAVPFESFDVLGDNRITTTYIDDYVVSVCTNSNK